MRHIGTKRPSIYEIFPSNGLTFEQAEAQYLSLEEKQKRIAKRAAREIRVRGISKDDIFPQELIDLKKQYNDISKQMEDLRIQFPRLGM